jgi:hypothetical protein
MKNRKKIIGLAIFFLLLLVFFGIMNLMKKNSTSVSIPFERNITSVNLKEISKIELEDAPHRILTREGKLYMLYDSLIYNLRGGNLEIITDKIKSNSSGNYYYFNNDSGFSVKFNIDQNKFYLENNSAVSIFENSNKMSNAIYGDNNIFCAIDTPLFNGKIFFEKIDVITKNKERILALADYLKDELKDCKECLSQTLEGNFFNIARETFGYYFYKGGFFLIFKNGAFNKYKTITKEPFIKFEQRQADFGGGKIGFICKPENDVYITLSACSNGNEIYLLSNKADKVVGKKRIVDIYDALSGNYKRSFSFDNYENAYPLEIGIVDKRLVIAYDNGICKVFETDLNEKN